MAEFTLLLTSSGQEWLFHTATDNLVVEEWEFHITTAIYWSRIAISQCYSHLVVKNGNFTLLLSSSGQEW